MSCEKMRSIDIRPVIRAIRETVDTHALAQEGAYCRWIWQNEAGTRNLGVNEYGCADALNILYTINDFVCDEQTRLARIAVLQSLQNPQTGMFTEATHHAIHTTAHCAAALELMDARPLYPIRELHQHMSREALQAFLEGLDWSSPWPESHRGAGIYAALVNSGEVTEAFQKNYFDWMWENADPQTGFWKKGYADRAPYNADEKQRGGGTPTAAYTYMAGGFHFMFNHEYAKMPLRYPDKIIDSCIKMYRENAIRKDFGQMIGFLEVDWAYCLNRASRQTTHRYGEVREALYDFAGKYTAYLLKLVQGEYKTNDRFNDLHMLFGCVCALAELQEALPGVIVTEKPLRLVLNRRPFI